MTDALVLIGGGLLLYFGAEWFVGGASALARSLRLPGFVIGLTLAAYGTSAPEIIVGFQAARSGHGDVALGNVIGSNSANLGLVLGVVTLMRPEGVDGTLRQRQLPMLVASSAVLVPLLADGRIQRWEAGVLLLVVVAHLGWTVQTPRGLGAVARADREAMAVSQAADAAGAPRPVGVRRATLTAAFGLTVLLVGGHLFVRGAVALAQRSGMSERLVGLTVVALGTSLPELVTSVIAARRGKCDFAVGNVVGSNVFNTLAGLGLAGLAGKVGMPLRSIAVELTGLFILTALAWFSLRRDRLPSRIQGAMLLVVYVGFTVVGLLLG